MATGRVPTTANSPLTAKGDLFGYSTTQARVAVGNDGETLVADSSTSTGLRYQGSMAAGRNFIINGGMDIWQRGTSFTNGNSTSTYGADRYLIYSNTSTGRTWSRQTTGDTTNLPSIQYCLRAARNSGDTQTNGIFIQQPFESANSIPLAGKTVVFSFYARAGANFSATSNAFAIQLITGTGTDQNSLTGFTGVATPINSSVTLTTTWQRFTSSVTLGGTITQLAVQLGYTPTGTAGANDYFEITGIQVEAGAVATQFSRAGATIQGELAACQRYYTRESVTTTYAYFRSSGNATNTTQARIIVPLPVQMRTKPAAMDTGGSLAVSDGVNLYTTGSFVLSANSTTQNAQVEYTHGSAVFTQFRYESLQDNNNGATYLGFSAEL